MIYYLLGIFTSSTFLFLFFILKFCLIQKEKVQKISTHKDEKINAVIDDNKKIDKAEFFR